MEPVLIRASKEDQQYVESLWEALGYAGTLPSVAHPSDIGREGEWEILIWSNAVEQTKEFMQIALRAWARSRLRIVKISNNNLPVGLRDLGEIVFEGYRARTEGKLVDELSKWPKLSSARTASASNFGEPDLPAFSFPKPRDSQARARRRPILIIAPILIALVSGGMWLATPRWELIEGPADPGAVMPRLLSAPLWALVIAFLFLLVWFALRRTVRSEASLDRVATSADRYASDIEDQRSGGHRVFVSYSRKDTPLVDGLVLEIERSGNRTWVDRAKTGNPQARYAAHIMKALRDTEYVALMCSKNAYLSDHVIREVYAAADMQKPFVVFMLDESQLPDEMLYFVTGFPRLHVSEARHDMASIFH
jgi:hypothetical protein